MAEKLNKFLTRKLTKSDVALDLDLKKLLGEIKLNVEQKEEVGQLVIDKILEKAAESKDRLGKKLPSYSKTYANSDLFKAFGKSKSKPNMRLSSDMLDQMDVTDIKGNVIRIGWDDEDQSAKAHGNITGQEGLWKKKRDFFGLTVEELNEIKQQVKGIIDGEG